MLFTVKELFDMRDEAKTKERLVKELKEMHDAWNESLELDCVGDTICATAQIINVLEDALNK